MSALLFGNAFDMLKNNIALLISLMVLSGCGQMGPLYLPPPPAAAQHAHQAPDESPTQKTQ